MYTVQQESLGWESSYTRPSAGFRLWSSQQLECRLVSQGQWVKNPSVCFSFFSPPKTVQGLGMVLKQQGSLKLARCESPIQPFHHSSKRARSLSLRPFLLIVVWVFDTLRHSSSSWLMMEIEGPGFCLNRMAIGQAIRVFFFFFVYVATYLICSINNTVSI